MFIQTERFLFNYGTKENLAFFTNKVLFLYNLLSSLVASFALFFSISCIFTEKTIPVIVSLTKSYFSEIFWSVGSATTSPFIYIWVSFFTSLWLFSSAFRLVSSEAYSWLIIDSVACLNSQSFSSSSSSSSTYSSSSSSEEEDELTMNSEFEAARKPSRSRLLSLGIFYFDFFFKSPSFLLFLLSSSLTSFCIWTILAWMSF